MHPQNVFELDPITSEPFIRLPKPHDKIVITPPRLSDAETIATYLNDPRVCYTLEGPPFPYLHEHAIDWLTRAKKVTDTAWSEIQDLELVASSVPTFEWCPVRAIREINDDGSQTFLGDCGIDRCGYIDIVDLDEQTRLTTENEARKNGDEDIVWMIGDYIAASHHGRGIMTAVFKCLIETWMIPWMAARKIRSTVHQGNIGSVRVFEKNGFVVEKTLENFKDRPENKGGGKIGLHIVDWKYPIT